MLALVSLIILFFSILATILIVLMAAIVILILLSLFLIIAIAVGVQQESIFKGLKVFIIACSILIIVPTISFLFEAYFANTFSISTNSLYLIGAVIGLVISILFSNFSLNLFEKFTKKTYKSMKKE